MLSVDGRCKTFDAQANGYARGEGVGAVSLFDRKVLHGAELLGSSVRSDGKSASLTAPNGSAQRTLLAITLGALQASEVRSLEMPGTGTALRPQPQ